MGCGSSSSVPVTENTPAQKSEGKAVLKEFANPFVNTQPSHDQLLKVWDAYDKNNDGDLSVKELQSLMKDCVAIMRDNLEANFARTVEEIKSKTDDAKLEIILKKLADCKAEFVKNIDEFERTTSEEKMEVLRSSLDTNLDGKLDKKEFLKRAGDLLIFTAPELTLDD